MSDSIDGQKPNKAPSNLYVEIRVPGSRQRGSGQVQDLSDNGVSFTTLESLEPGTKIYIRIPFVNSRTPPLMSPAEVISCHELADDEGYAISCAFD